MSSKRSAGIVLVLVLSYHFRLRSRVSLLITFHPARKQHRAAQCAAGERHEGDVHEVPARDVVFDGESEERGGN